MRSGYRIASRAPRFCAPDHGSQLVRKGRRGWYLGEPRFADKLLALGEGKPDRRTEGRDPMNTHTIPVQLYKGKPDRRTEGRDQTAKGHDESYAEDFVRRILRRHGMPMETAALAELRKGDPRMLLVAVLVRRNTSVSNRWLADRMVMGHTAGVSRLLNDYRKDKMNMRKLAELEKMFR